MPSFSIDGITSGLDTTSIIDTLIEFERQPAVLMENEQAEKTNIISSLEALQAKMLALQTSAGKLAKKTNYNKASINISDESVVSATAKGRVSVGSYDLQVLSLARNHQIASQGFEDDSKAIMGTGTIEISVGEGSLKTITIDSGNNSLVGIRNAINDARAGVSATIVHDGSSSDPFRLILSADNTGVKNKISVTSNLTGGENLNYTTATFDSPEEIDVNNETTSVISLGSTASFTGNENKIYTFTVDGTGSYTVGEDNITINWSDGTNSGQIMVTQADTEVELVGTGADGLKLSLSAGEIFGGDVFQISSFSPLLQDASDARIAVGSTGGSGSPITVTSASNTFQNVIGGVELRVSGETTPGSSVHISTDIDVSGIKDMIQSFLNSYNDVNDYINEQNTYNEEDSSAGVLFGDYTLQIMQNSLSRSLINRIDGLQSQYNQLYSIGIRTDADGNLAIKDSSRLEDALRNNYDDVINLFTAAGTSSSNNVTFVSSGTDTQNGEYEVDITQAATHGYFQGSAITSPGSTPLTLTSANNRLQLNVDGLHSDEIVLSARTYNSIDDLVNELQERIDNDTKIGDRGLTVEWVETGSNMGYLKLESSTYGSSSKVGIITSVPNSALTQLGLITGVNHDGLDVAGTINGEPAEGKGQILTGSDDNATTAGLKIQVNLESSQLGEGAEATIVLSKGVAARLSDKVESLTLYSNGLLDRQINRYKKQVEDLQAQISAFDERLAARREDLQNQFNRMEEILTELNSQSSYFSSQLSQIQANWQSSSIGG